MNIDTLDIIINTVLLGIPAAFTIIFLTIVIRKGY
jgi:hypothetical protein